MSGIEAYGFALAMVAGLLILVLPLSLALMRVPPARMWGSLRAGAIGGGVALAVGAGLGPALFAGPLRTGAGTADDLAVLVAVGAALAVVLATLGAGMIELYRGAGMLDGTQARGTALVLVACWFAVMAMFAGAVLL